MDLQSKFLTANVISKSLIGDCTELFNRVERVETCRYVLTGLTGLTGLRFEGSVPTVFYLMRYMQNN